MRLLGTILILAASCTAAGNEAKDIAGDVGIELEFACGFVGDTCGQVFQCTAFDATAAEVTMELCWVDGSSTELETSLSEQYYEVSCQPTPRGSALGWPCIYGCEPHRGCNAFNGCWCGQ